jgi:hypothetical protein
MNDPKHAELMNSSSTILSEIKGLVTKVEGLATGHLNLHSLVSNVLTKVESVLPSKATIGSEVGVVENGIIAAVHAKLPMLDGIAADLKTVVNMGLGAYGLAPSPQPSVPTSPKTVASAISTLPTGLSPMTSISSPPPSTAVSAEQFTTLSNQVASIGATINNMNTQQQIMTINVQGLQSLEAKINTVDTLTASLTTVQTQMADLQNIVTEFFKQHSVNATLGTQASSTAVQALNALKTKSVPPTPTGSPPPVVSTTGTTPPPTINTSSISSTSGSSTPTSSSTAPVAPTS